MPLSIKPALAIDVGSYDAVDATQGAVIGLVEVFSSASPGFQIEFYHGPPWVLF